MTNYDGWYRFDDEDDTDTKEDEYDLVEVHQSSSFPSRRKTVTTYFEYY